MAFRDRKMEMGTARAQLHIHVFVYVFYRAFILSVWLCAKTIQVCHFYSKTLQKLLQQNEQQPIRLRKIFLNNVQYAYSSHQMDEIQQQQSDHCKA